MVPTHALHRAGVLAAVALIAAAFSVSQVNAVGTDNPPAPSGCDKKKNKNCATETQEQQLAHQKFLGEYRAARALILAGHYEAGIDAMRALHRDDHPDVANYIGYANRKRGDYDAAKHWYEKALAADPNHVRTWSYYGMWHAELGHSLQAEQYLQKVKFLCGNTSCKEFVQLRDVIDNKATY